MPFNIDIAIFVTFLAVNLVVGLWYGKGIKTIKEYAIGNKDFSTAAIAATLVATWISGGAFSFYMAETYTQGLYFVMAIIADAASFFIIGYVFAPRMKQFLGKLSVAEAIGEIYGNKVRIIIAVTGSVATIGALAIQFKIFSSILTYFLDIPIIYSTLISSAVVIMYSAFGGVRSVTFTDMIQLFTFSTLIPILGIVIWSTFTDSSSLITLFTTNPAFDYRQIFDYKNPKILGAIAIFIYFLIPGFSPATFQRITMGKDITQVRRSFYLASVILLVVELLMAWIAVLVLAQAPDINPNNIINHIIDNYSYPGLKGFIIVGVMAMVMSTADSYINSSAVLFTHDFCAPLGLVTKNRELFLSRTFSLFIGLMAVMFTLYTESLFSLFLLGYGPYMAVVTVPFILTILGFRSNSRSIIFGMLAGMLTIAIWPKLGYTEIDEVIPSMAANLLALMAAHYLFYRERKSFSTIHYAKQLVQKEKVINNVMCKVLSFNSMHLLKSNLPKSESTYPLFGLFCIISVFSTMYSMPIHIREAYSDVLEFIYHSVLISSYVFLTYVIWPPTFKKERFMSIFWNIGLVYTLVFVGCLQVTISNFGTFQSMIFLLNMVVISMLLPWKGALFGIFSGVFASVVFFEWYSEPNAINTNTLSLQFKIMYFLLLMSSILIAFIKPKQEQYALSEEKNEHLHGRITAQEEEVRNAMALKSEFIRNVEHEYHAPMTGITSMAQVLSESYGALNDEQRQEAAKSIFQSSLRLEQFDKNINSLATLSKAGYQLKLEQFDLSSLVEERVKTCRKLYEADSENREFICNIKDGIEIKADKQYLVQALDNLIINAITYCQKGRITITLSKNNEGVIFSIEDEGLGIPSRELDEIFLEFTVSSRTKTPAGGRGVGLALCKRVIEVHGGKIWAESDGTKGAAFTFVLNN